MEEDDEEEETERRPPTHRVQKDIEQYLEDQGFGEDSSPYNDAVKVDPEN